MIIVIIYFIKNNFIAYLFILKCYSFNFACGLKFGSFIFPISLPPASYHLNQNVIS